MNKKVVFGGILLGVVAAVVGCVLWYKSMDTMDFDDLDDTEPDADEDDKDWFGDGE